MIKNFIDTKIYVEFLIDKYRIATLFSGNDIYTFY